MPALLRAPSPARWLQAALEAPDLVLLDLAHCEKRAASTVLSFLFRVTDPELAPILSRMAREELTHFEWCLRLLAARGVNFDRLHPAAYAGSLAASAHKRGPAALLDGFLVAALIEARSGERLALLRDHTPEEALRSLFAALCPPEERHVELLYEIAGRFESPEAPLGERLAVLSAREAELILLGEPDVRIHS